MTANCQRRTTNSLLAAMTSATAILCMGLASLLCLALVSDARAGQSCSGMSENANKAWNKLGRRTYTITPKPTVNTNAFLETCEKAEAAYKCIKPLADNYDPRGDFVNFDLFVKKYVHCAFGEWYATNMNLSHIDPMLPGFYLKMAMKNMEYKDGSLLTQSMPEVLLVKKFHNKGAEYVKSEVMQSVERTQTTSNTVGKGLSTSASVEAGLKTPFVEASVKAEVNFNLDSSRTQTESHTRTLSLSDTILVPPNSTVKLVWSISQAEKDVPWTGELHISGWIPVKLREKEYLYIPVGHMAAFYDEFFEADLSTSMVYHTMGNFRGVMAVDSNIDTVEMGLHEDSKCSKKKRVDDNKIYKW